MEQNWNLAAKPKRKRRRFWLKLAAGLLFAVVAYGGAYLAVMEPVAVGWRSVGWDVGHGTPVHVYRSPKYPSALIGSFFVPAHWIDRNLRPEFWRLLTSRSGAGGSDAR